MLLNLSGQYRVGAQSPITSTANEGIAGTHWIKPQGQKKSLQYRQVHNQNLNLRIFRCRRVQNQNLKVKTGPKPKSRRRYIIVTTAVLI